MAGSGEGSDEAMSETTTETWAVVDEAGAIHEVDVSEGRTGSPPWVAHVADGTARRSLTSARDAVVLMAQARGWSVAEVLAPGQVSRAGIERERDEARGLLDSVREALGPTCADATHEALPGLVRTVVQCDAATHEWCDEQREQLRETAAEVAHLEARRGALIAEVDRLAARDRDAGVVIEDLRKMLAGASVDLAAARDDAAQARLDGAREMREQPVAWGAMPTAAEVAAHVARAEPYPHAGAPWLRRYIAFDGSDVTGIEVVYLYVDRERVMTRRPTHGVVYGATVREIASEWRPIDSDGVAVLTGGAQ